jgi:hypothetical protein
MEDRSQSRSHVLRCPVGVKMWPPDIDAARPAHCAGCGEATYASGRLLLHGNGLVDRQMRGPATPDGPATIVVIKIREYECQSCKAVMRVVPRGVVERKHFSGCAIAMVLALVGLMGATAADARRRVNEAKAGYGAKGWSTVGRWVADVANGKLFARLDLRDLPQGTFEVARRAAQALCGRAPPTARSGPFDHQAFAGAVM